jgi:caffeoyl-CoA O-methyltransferase
MQVLSQLSYSPTASRMVPRFDGDAILRATMPERLPADPRLLRDIDAYIEGLFAPPEPALAAALADAREAGLPGVEVSPNEGKLLQVLVALVGARRVLEIGTLGGYSAIWMARALPVDGLLVTLELDPAHAAVARRSIARAGLADRVEVRVGRALHLLAAMVAAKEQAFDAVFIDADKDAYPEYLAAVRGLVHPGGLILADNVLRGRTALEPRGPEAQGIARFNELVAADPRLSGTIVPLVREVVDGLAIVRVLAS